MHSVGLVLHLGRADRLRQRLHGIPIDPNVVDNVDSVPLLVERAEANRVDRLLARGLVLDELALISLAEEPRHLVAPAHRVVVGGRARVLAEQAFSAKNEDVHRTITGLLQ